MRPGIKAPPDGKWSAGQLPGEFTFKEGEDSLWLERDVEIPKSFAGRRVVLHVNQLFFAMSVEVNGTPVGDLPPWGGDLDITRFARVGETNRIRLFFGRLAKGHSGVDALTQSAVNMMEAHQGPRLGHLGYYDKAGINCLPRDFYLESQPADGVRITDVWFKTYTRGGLRIEPEVTFVADRPMTGVTARLTIFEGEEGDGPVREASFAVTRLDVGESRKTFPISATGLKLWSLREGHLYRGQVILCDSDGRELDRSIPVAFGIREFWTQGRDFYLNGERVFFAMDGLHSKFRTVREAFDAGVTLLPGRVWNSEHMLINYESQFEEADRLGMATTSNGVTTRHLDLTDFEVLRAYRVWTTEHLRKLRNHPSILYWGLDYNIGIGPNSFWPTELGRSKFTFWGNANVSIAHLVHRETDPTRDTYVHGGIIAPGLATCNIYLNHIPLQEAQEWPSEWAEKGDRPFIPIEYMGSVLEQDFQKNMRSYVTEYAARLQGDRAYLEEPDAYVSYAAFEVPRFEGDVWAYVPGSVAPAVPEILIDGHLRVARAWRFQGVSLRPWIFNPDLFEGGDRSNVPEERRTAARAMWQACLDSHKPVQAWIGGPAGCFTDSSANFQSGETIEKSLVAIRDLTGMASWTVTWDATLDGGTEPAASGSFSQSAGPYARIQTPFRFIAPAVDRPTRLTLTLAVQDRTKGEPVARDTFEAWIFPVESAAARAEPALRAAVLDPESETVKWLQSLGVETLVFAPGEPRPEADVLVLGRRALKSIRGTLPFTAQELEDGLRVILFEQHCRDLSRIGLRNEDQVPRQAFIRRPDHPFMSGLESAYLRNWRGEGTLIGKGPEGDRIPQNKRTGRWGNRGSVASVIAETPHLGPFSPIVECEFDLAYSPLLTLRHGRGEIVFSQFDLAGRVGFDPAATRLARNLVKYLSTPLQAPPQSKIAVAWDPGLVERIRQLGFESDPLPAAPDPERHLIVLAGDSILSAEQRAVLSAFTGRGGEALVLGARKDPMGGEALDFRPVRITRADREADAHPLLAGAGPQLLHWREPLDFTAVSARDSEVTVLLGGLLALQPSGSGRLIYLQAIPEAADDLTAAREADPFLSKAGVEPVADDWRAANRARTRSNLVKLQSRVLANLGVRAAPDLIARLLEVKPVVATTVAVNDWVYLGPFAPVDDPNADPLEADLSAFRLSRDLDKTFVNTRGERVAWSFPTDSQNGLGLGGFMDLSRVYGARLKHTAFAATQIYSSKPRKATVKFGADWWAVIYVNGREVFRTVEGTGHESHKLGGTFGDGFANTFTVDLQAGWNDVCVQVAAGQNGHNFSFKISNPGDLVVEQAIVAPAEAPSGLPPTEELLAEYVDPGRSLYVDTLEELDDPYQYIRW
jgi:beta-galactosidase